MIRPSTLLPPGRWVLRSEVVDARMTMIEVSNAVSRRMWAIPSTAVALVFSSLAVPAQTDLGPMAKPPGARPAEAGASVPPVAYRSSFSGYRHFTEPAVAPWGSTQRLQNAGASTSPAAPASTLQAPAVKAPGPHAMPGMTGHKMD